MAHLSNDSLGLNEISLLQLNHCRNNHTHISNIGKNIEIEMDKKSGLSRIPKLTYSTKRTQQATENSGIPSRDSTPVSDNRYIVKSAPASQQTSPIVGRSKSLRLPRKQYVGLESNSASRLEPQAGKFSRGLKDKGRKNLSSSPESSRTTSPGNATATDHSDFVSSAETSGTDLDLVKSGNTGNDDPFLRRRAQSFGPHTQRNRSIKRPIGNRQLRRPAASSRNNTPTPTGIRSITPSSLPVPTSHRQKGGAVTPSGHRHVRSRSSLGTNSHTTSGGHSNSVREETDSSLKIRRADSNEVLHGSRPLGRGKLIKPMGNRGKRPTSYVMEAAADLNQLAQEITSSMEDNSLHTPEVKSVARLQSAARHRGLTSSMPSSKEGVASGNHTPSANSGYSHRQLNSNARSTSLEKLHAPLGRGTKYNFQQKTPEIGGNGRIRSSSFIGSGGPLEEGKLSNYPHSRGTMNSHSSTPSSGRSTPVSGTLVEKKAKDSRISPTNEKTPAGGQSKLPGSRLQATQRRIVRVREARPVGINELEGAVLMDADEYLKISHEVKALKTAMLKLKRELQTDLQMGHIADNGSTPAGSKTPRRTGSGSQTVDLGKRIDQLTAEKRQALEEASRHKSDLQKVSDQLDRLNSDLKRAEEEKSSLSERLQQIESHRDLLLDKVERLHADKHKLEDRLSSSEKAQFYEESSSWLEEVDGGGEEWEETLMLGGVKGEKTESDIGENSEPESSAVCGGPHS